MSEVEPLPIEIAIPEIPPEFSPQEIGIWIWTTPETLATPDIPIEIEFPLIRPRRVPLRIKVGRHVFEVALALTADEGVPVVNTDPAPA
jgi:hypothetical protein